MENLIEAWDRRLHDARLFGYSVKAEVLIEQFLNDLRGPDRVRSTSRLLTLKHIHRVYYPDFHIQTLQRWARDGKWAGAHKTMEAKQSIWVVPEESVMHDLHGVN